MAMVKKTGRRTQMRRLTVFNSVSADGYFTDANGDMSWAHKNDPEINDFTANNAKGSGGGTLLFGRVTYDMMKAFWPTPEAAKTFPDVAQAMNALSKVVFSKTMKKADWQNTKLVKDDPIAVVKAMKQESGPDIVVMGSGTIVALLAEAGLVDEYQLVVNPLVLGDGRTLFEGVKKPLPLKLVNERRFKNGNVLLCYQPAK
jgi:dihydrofolate reductase